MRKQKYVCIKFISGIGMIFFSIKLFRHIEGFQFPQYFPTAAIIVMDLSYHGLYRMVYTLFILPESTTDMGAVVGLVDIIILVCVVNQS